MTSFWNKIKFEWILEDSGGHSLTRAVVGSDSHVFIFLSSSFNYSHSFKGVFRV